MIYMLFTLSFSWYICYYLLLYGVISLKIVIENLTRIEKLMDSFLLYSYHAEGFKVFSLSILLGVQARLICYIITVLLGFIMLALTPSKQLWFSKLNSWLNSKVYNIFIPNFGLFKQCNYLFILLFIMTFKN